LNGPIEPSLQAKLRELKLHAGLATATLHRRRLRRVAVIGVTGSCGKTTTKELIAAALSSELRGRKSPGTGNGLPIVGKTILRTTNRDGFCVVEVAAGEGLGYVARTAQVLRPDIAVVTNVGSDHRAIFRTLEATAAEKRALVDGVVDGGAAVLNADDPLVLAMGERFHGRILTFGCSQEAMLRAENVRSAWPDRLTFTLRCDGRELPVRTRLYGKHWVASALAALGVARAMGVSLDRAVGALATVEPTPNRMRAVLRNGITFIQDDAKAPFWAFDAVFEFLADARAARKIVVIGTISDYPGSASKKYRLMARRALAVADEVVFAGPQASHVVKAKDDAPAGALHAFPTVPEAADYLRSNLRDGDLVVVKGSGTTDSLERIVLAL
jgi:UDP-N-acetylmuramoyl-tripeptide--D-alanyl-D-alanine ligase